VQNVAFIKYIKSYIDVIITNLSFSLRLPSDVTEVFYSACIFALFCFCVKYCYPLNSPVLSLTHIQTFFVLESSVLSLVGIIKKKKKTFLKI
jgi:hypothetical protein